MVTQYLMNRWMDKHLRPRMPQEFALQVLQGGPADVLSRGCCAWDCHPRVVSGTLHVILSAKEPGQGPPPVTWVPQFPVRILRPEIKAQAATLPRLFAMATSGSHSWAGSAIAQGLASTISLLSLCYTTMFCQASTRKKHGCRAAEERPSQPSRACLAEFPDSGSQTVESLPHRASEADSSRGSCPAVAG